ncbi:XRE family transcriptional regulator [Psychrobacter sanguinis]|uniref:XRE family transcriptional regulator n=1 Tax=Psychrobacter sanguinis TaxID=861445 RepID=UPI0019192784|nr:XRE family transcriptional regulator [Psychrobacter sanguinis]MCC3308289.1 helix-turn-helix domain-containing protein [Psychrobacter sanguinis]
MAKKFSQLKASLPTDVQERIDSRANAEVKRLLAEMPLHELRQARGLSQTLLAQHLGIGQPSIAKLEKRTDMYLSTLRSHIQAMGGTLDIIARFPEGDVKITNFSDLESNIDTDPSEA